MEHQYTSAATTSTNLKTGAIRREGVWPYRPFGVGAVGGANEFMLLSDSSGLIQRKSFVVAFVVIKHRFKHPIRSRFGVFVCYMWSFVAVFYSLQVSIGPVVTILFAWECEVYVFIVLRLVLIRDDVSLIVVGLGNQP